MPLPVLLLALAAAFIVGGICFGCVVAKLNARVKKLEEAAA